MEILPLIKYYMDKLGVAQLFGKYIPNKGMEIAPAQVLSMMLMNIMVSAKPLYRMEDWLHDYLDGVTEERFEAAKYNDDRLVRNLDFLFDADRSSFMAELSANAIRAHQLETEVMHNDSTSITFLGAYNGEDPEAVRRVRLYSYIRKKLHKIRVVEAIKSSSHKSTIFTKTSHKFSSR